MFAAIGNDANDGRPHCLPALVPRARRPVRLRARRRRRPRDRRARAAAPRPPLPALRGDRQEPAARLDRARRRRRGPAGRRRRVRAERKRLAVRKTAGNVVELGSIAAFGFSPLWLLAAGSRRHPRDARLPRRLRAGAQARRRPCRGGAPAVGRRSARRPGGRLGDGGAADRHPPARARRPAADPSPTCARMRAGSPRRPRWPSLFDGLRAEAVRERRSLLEVSTGVGIAFFNSARHIGRQHVLDPYGEDLARSATRASARYAARVASRTARPSRATSTRSGQA